MAETIDQQFIEYIVKALVGNPDAVKVDRTIDEKGVLLELHVDPTDLGRVIGRGGATAKSIRILLRALGVKNDARYNLKIIDDNEGQRPDRREDDRARDMPAATSTDEPAAPAQDEPQDEPAVQDEPQDQPVSDQPVQDEPQQTEDTQPVVEAAPAAETQETPDDMVSRSRKELEDLNDLDI